jgi:hypothetical protein
LSRDTLFEPHELRLSRCRAAKVLLDLNFGAPLAGFSLFRGRFAVSAGKEQQMATGTPCSAPVRTGGAGFYSKKNSKHPSPSLPSAAPIV